MFRAGIFLDTEKVACCFVKSNSFFLGHGHGKSNVAELIAETNCTEMACMVKTVGGKTSGGGVGADVALNEYEVVTCLVADLFHVVDEVCGKLGVDLNAVVGGQIVITCRFGMAAECCDQSGSNALFVGSEYETVHFGVAGIGKIGRAHV